MYVVIEVGGKQYKVSQGDEIEVEKLKANKNETVKLDKVLLSVDEKKIEVGNPYLKDTYVIGEVLGHFKGAKKISFKYRRRKSSKTKKGHRQKLTRLKVKEIQLK